jgi:hypothetical protein
MAKRNTQPIFTNEPLVGSAQATVANANRDGTGTIVVVATGNAQGTRIDLVRLHAIVTTTAGMSRLSLNDGSNVRLWDEIPVTAVTASGTVPAFKAEVVPTEPLVLPNANWTLEASTQNAEAMNIFAHGGHLEA